jgi:signal transduction histidine kinase
MTARRTPRRGRGGLALRVAMASVLLSLIVGGVFTLLVGAITGMRAAAVLSRHSEQVLASANGLERLVVDLETGQRGFLITHDPAFLQPWTAARESVPKEAAELRRLTKAGNANHANHANHAGQAKRADQIARDAQSYITDYSEPLVKAAQANQDVGPNSAGTSEGKRRVDRLRSEFHEFVQVERGVAAERDARARTTARRAVVIAVGGVGASTLLVVAFGGYLTRGVVRPIRRTSRMAGAVARGDLTVRVPETGKAEIGDLEHSFNSMAGALERNRAELTASRARIVTAGDAARRRIERDLHDGTQQRLVTLSLELRMTAADVPKEHEPLRRRLTWAVKEMTDIVHELREISRGIHPAILMKGGIGPALAALARRSPVPVEVRLDADRKLPEQLEIATYYIVSEALTNVAKHANASRAWVELEADGSDVRLSIRDDGVGGADTTRGSGLIGLQDRVEALGGEVKVISPLHDGTTLDIRIPVG